MVPWGKRGTSACASPIYRMSTCLQVSTRLYWGKRVFRMVPPDWSGSIVGGCDVGGSGDGSGFLLVTELLVMLLEVLVLVAVGSGSGGGGGVYGSCIFSGVSGSGG
eukprot:9483893-Ditylum_brightwellii.AAC.1